MKPRDGEKRVTVTFGKVALDCHFNYYKGCPASLSGPEEPEAAEFYSVLHKGECVYQLLGDENVHALAEKCIEAIKDREVA